MSTYVLVELCVYLYVIPPELQQCEKSSLHLAEQLVEEGQLSHTILIQQGAQTWHKNITRMLQFHVYDQIKFTNWKIIGWVQLDKEGTYNVLLMRLVSVL